MALLEGSSTKNSPASSLFPNVQPARTPGSSQALARCAGEASVPGTTLVLEHREQSRTQGPGLASLSLKWGVQPMSSRTGAASEPPRRPSPSWAGDWKVTSAPHLAARHLVRGGETPTQSWGRPPTERSSPLAMGQDTKQEAGPQLPR